MVRPTKKPDNDSGRAFEARLRTDAYLRGIDANLGPRNDDSFRADLHPDLNADFAPIRKDLANPPFNMSDWGGENLRQDVRWKFGMSPVQNPFSQN